MLNYAIVIVLALPLSELAAVPKAKFQKKNHHQPKFYLHAMHETNCKVEFNQPSCWLYSVPNLLVF